MERNDFQDLRTRIDYTRIEFTSIDESIAVYLESIGDLEKIIDLGLTGIAENCYVSKASVSRFFRKLGYSSYDEFRFQSEVKITKNIKTNILNKEALFKSLYGMYLDLLDQQVHLLDLKYISKLVEDIQSHRSTYVIGAGQSGFYARRFSYLLSRFGFTSTFITDSDEIIIKSVVADTKDFYIFFSASGNTSAIITNLRELQKKNVKSALITQFSGSPSVQYADYYILTPIQSTNTSASDIPALFIIDLVILFLSRTDNKSRQLYDETFSTLRKIRQTKNRKEN